jgi:hypothetical protein
MDGEDPKVETEAEGANQVDDTNKQRQNDDDDQQNSQDQSQNQDGSNHEDEDGDVDQQQDNSQNQEENSQEQDRSQQNENESVDQENKPQHDSAEVEAPETMINIDMNQIPAPIGPDTINPSISMPIQFEVEEEVVGIEEVAEIKQPSEQEPAERNEVYDRHQEEAQEYQVEPEGENYQYEEEDKELDYGEDDEETKRLYDDEVEDEMHQNLDQEEYEEEEEEEEDLMQNKIRAIIDLCQQNSGKYGDTDFPTNDASLYKNPAEPPDYAEDDLVVEWMRPEDASKSGNEDEIKMIQAGMRPGDIKQGKLGDCWLLGAFLTLATHPELLQNLIVHDGIKHGFAVFQFFKNGEWKQVLVDTRLPYSKNGNPLYGHCADATEVWVPLMEKAYAKLHG